MDDRKALCNGVCHVLASLPDSQRGKSLLALAMPALDCLETMIQHANQASNNNSSQEQIDLVLDRIASEIIMITTMARAFTNAFSIKEFSMESGCRTSDGHAAIVEPALAIIKQAWSPISRVASAYNYSDVSSSLLDCCLVKMKLTFFSLWLSLVCLGIAGIFFDAMPSAGMQ